MKFKMTKKCLTRKLNVGDVIEVDGNVIISVNGVKTNLTRPACIDVCSKEIKTTPAFDKLSNI